MLEGSDELEVPLIQVASKELAKIVEFMHMYKESPLAEIKKPLPSNEMSKNVGESYAAFVDSLAQSDLFSLINAANFMQVQPLLELCCCKIASYLVGKKREQIPQLFGLPADTPFTDEDKAKVYTQFPWVHKYKEKLEQKLRETEK